MRGPTFSDDDDSLGEVKVKVKLFVKPSCVVVDIGSIGDGEVKAKFINGRAFVVVVVDSLGIDNLIFFLILYFVPISCNLCIFFI